MILEAAIINVTRNLDLITQKEQTEVSSNSKVKEEGLLCLIQLIERAPQAEYKKLIQSEHCDILIGYLFNILCQLAKNDKSRKIRSNSLKVLCSLLRKLNSIHDVVYLGDRCCIAIVESALPGVSSTLFKLITSDVKLSKELLKTSIRTLSLFIITAVKSCNHRELKRNVASLKEICDNIAIRTSFLIDYIINNASQLHEEIEYEVLSFCHDLVCHTTSELLEKIIKTVVRYLAFFSPDNFKSKELKHEAQLKNLLINNYMQDFMEKDGNQGDNLQSTIITSLFHLLDELENEYLTMLLGEREAKLSMLHGFCRLLPGKSITTFLQLTDRRKQLLNVLTKLSEFSTKQPFLFLTDVNVGPEALETNNDKIYTAEKLFAHLSHNEVQTIIRICHIIAINTDWLTFNDFFNESLSLPPLSSRLFINHLFIDGLLNCAKDKAIKNFTSQNISLIIEQTQEMYNSLKADQDTTSEMVMRTVISIEILVSLIELHAKNSDHKEKLIILMFTLCPLLSLASSSFRSISEASLSGLAKISRVYEYDSTRSLIEANIDYIINGVMRLLDNYLSNSEVTNILALTFKLSSIDNFYFFKDVYERIFRILGSCQNRGLTRSIALLFYRTLSIIKDRKSCEKRELETGSLSESTIKVIKYDLNIDRRLDNLNSSSLKLSEEAKRMDQILGSKVDEEEITKEVQGQQTTPNQSTDGATSLEDEKTTEIIFTEKIVTHCLHMISCDDHDTKVLALKAASCGLWILSEHENTLLPLVHQIWSPLLSRLTSGDYKKNLEVNICAFDCLVVMAQCAKDFIKKRLLDSVLPRLCLFLETQAPQSRGQKDYGPYSMTIAFKCQQRILSQIGRLCHDTEVGYTSLWRIIQSILIYLSNDQPPTLRQSAALSLQYLMILDADCVWYFAKHNGNMSDLPFDLIYNNN